MHVPTVQMDHKIIVLTETINRLHRRGATKALQNVLNKTFPTDLANVLRQTPEEDIVPLFRAMAKKQAAEVLDSVVQRVLDRILAEIPPEELAPVVDHLAPDDLADLIARLPAETAEKIKAALAKDSKQELEELLQYAPNSAGGIMTTDVFALAADTPVKAAVETIRSLSDVEMVFYLYVVDDERRLIGVISMRQLVMSKSDVMLRDIMNSRVIRVHTEDKQETVARLAQNYRVLAVPVVDAHEHLVGIVTVDDIIDVIQEETTRDMLKMAGTDESETLTRSPFKIARVRLPWLLAAFMGGLAATGVIHYFEGLLSQVLALSAFLPVIMGMAGNVGVQTATVAVRGLAIGSINVKHLGSVITKELSVGVLLGIFYGIILGAFGWFSFGNLALGEIVGLTVLINMIGAAGLAVMLPILFHRLGVDPAIATGPFVTTAIDILGVGNYFLIATLILHL